MITTKRLVRIGVLNAGIVMTVFYGLIALLIVPFLIIIPLVGPAASGGGSSDPDSTALDAGVMVATAVFMPLVYAPFGFVFGVITAAIYNLVARFTGGLEFQFADDAPPDPGPS